MNKYTLAKHKTLTKLCEKQEQRIAELEAHCNDLKNGINKIYLMDGEELMYGSAELCEQLSVRTPRQSSAHIQREAIETMEKTLKPSPVAAENYWFDTGYWQAKQDIKEYAEQLTDNA